jgi:hypothetical protein
MTRAVFCTGVEWARRSSGRGLFTLTIFFSLGLRPAWPSFCRRVPPPLAWTFFPGCPVFHVTEGAQRLQRMLSTCDSLRRPELRIHHFPCRARDHLPIRA